MTKKQRALEIIERLKKEYPDADCTLDYEEAWKLLVSVRLAAQCTDARVNVVVQGLFAKYPDVDALAAADVDDIEQIVRPCGLGRSKARDISACMKMLRDEYGGKVPEDFDALLKLPGVGRKTANIVLNVGFGIVEGIAVDTHVNRIAHRLMLSPKTHAKEPLKTERDLLKILPHEYWESVNHQWITFGREICDARKPKCDECPLADLCPSVRVAG